MTALVLIKLWRKDIILLNRISDFRSIFNKYAAENIGKILSSMILNNFNFVIFKMNLLKTFLL
jgi:hypothetical protein